ncbi:MAG: sulfatase [Pirellulaceae bacterium]
MILTVAVWIVLHSKVDAHPNVLLIVADDLNCAISPYGDAVAVTPNLQRLAARGLVFERAYCQQAVCNPSRSSFLTGLRPSTVQVDDLRKWFRESALGGSTLITLPQHFKNHGYFCQNIGKMFHNMGDTQDRRSWSIDEVLHKGTHAADTVTMNTPPSLRRFDAVKAPVTEAMDVPDTAYRDGQIANLASAMLREHPADGQPFFLAVGFWRPHLPFVAPKKYWELYDPRDIAVPLPAQRPTDAPDIALHASREIRGYDGVTKEGDFTPEEIRHYRHGYYASISFMDAQIGKILDALESGGHASNTIVVFTSDHGFHIGEHALWGKTSNFELDARVPLIIADPGRQSGHGKSTVSLVELVDLYPTLAALAGIDKSSYRSPSETKPSGDMKRITSSMATESLNQRLEGSDLSPVLSDPAVAVKEAASHSTRNRSMGHAVGGSAWVFRSHRQLAVYGMASDRRRRCPRPRAL